MDSKNTAFVLNLRLQKSSSANEIHDAIIEELILACNERQEAPKPVLNNGAEVGPSSTSRRSVELNGIPISSELIKDVAVSPPYFGIILKNGKACRFKISKERNTTWPSLKGKVLETKYVPSNSRNDSKTKRSSESRKDFSIESVELKRSKEDLLDGLELKRSKEDLLDGLGLKDNKQYALSPKRARLSEEGESGESSIQFGSGPEDSINEESFEKGCFEGLMDIGLNDDNEVSSLDQRLNAIERAFSQGGIVPILESELVQGSTLPYVVQDDEPDSLSNISVDANATVFPNILQEASQIGGTAPSNLQQPQQETNDNKRINEYPPGFRPMSQKLSFMNKAAKSDEETLTDSVASKASSSDIKKISEIPGSCIEWIQSDYKDIQFERISALHSEFILVSKSTKKLWSWPIPRQSYLENPVKAKPYPNADRLGLGDERIELLHSNVIRATVVTESGKICTFFDSLLTCGLSGRTPSLIKKLTMPANMFQELGNEVIIDVKNSHLYSVALTLSGKVFWWGLAPEHLRRSPRISKQTRRNSHDAALQIGDIVTLKDRKEEIGAVVMKNTFLQGPLIGKVVRIQELDRSVDATERKQYTVELGEHKTKGGSWSKKVAGHINHPSTSGSTASKKRDTTKEEWSSDEIIFLEERAGTVGTIVALDGHYVVLKSYGKIGTAKEPDQKLKVCLKSSLTKVTDSTEINLGAPSEFLVNEFRYEHAIREKPTCVVDPAGAEHQYNGFKAVAVSATNLGLAMLLNRISDHKAFLVQPDGLKEDNSKIFTCSAKKTMNEREVLVNDSNITSEYESVCAKLCMLDVSIEDSSEQNSETILLGNCNISTPKESVLDDESVTIKQFRHSIQAPRLINLNGLDCTMLLDRNDCIYPISFNTCLQQSGILEAPPLRLFVPIEASYGNESNDEMTISIIAAPKSMVLAPSIIYSNKEKFDKVMHAIEQNLRQKDGPDSDDLTTKDESLKSRYSANVVDLEILSEKCSGNQNIMHLCAGNVMNRKTDGKHPAKGNITSSDGIYMLQRILDCCPIRRTVISLLKERDCLKCTPFLTAIWTRNFKAAFTMLNSFLQWYEIDPSLYRSAIGFGSIYGMTPLHHLVFSTSRLQPDNLLKNSLLISNIPANYSPRMLLQLFKERYSSAYRACIPVPEERWKIRLASEKHRRQNETRQEKEHAPSHPTPVTFVPRYMRSTRVMPIPTHARAQYGILNRADAMRITAKQGLVMFSDFEEMNQALAEMAQHPLVCKDDRAPAGLTSVSHYYLQVHRLDDPTPESQASTRENLLNSSRPTRHTFPPSLQASALRLPRGHLFSDAALSHDIAHVRHILPQAMMGARVQAANTLSSSKESSSEKSDKTPKNESTEDKGNIMIVQVLRAMLAASPEMSVFVNDQQETALAFYLKNAKRLTPNGLYSLFSKWRVCQPNHCFLERLKYIGIRPVSIELKQSSSELGDFDKGIENDLEIDTGTSKISLDIDSMQYTIPEESTAKKAKMFESKNDKSSNETSLDPSCKSSPSSQSSHSSSSRNVDASGVSLKESDSSVILRSVTSTSQNLSRNSFAAVETGHTESLGKIQRNRKRPHPDVASSSITPGSNSQGCNDHSVPSLLDEKLPHGIPDVGLRPKKVTPSTGYDKLTSDELGHMLLFATDRPIVKTMNDASARNEERNSMHHSNEVANEVANAYVSTSENNCNECTCLRQFVQMKGKSEKIFFKTISTLVSMKGSVLGTILGGHSEGESSGIKNFGRSQYPKLDIESLDEVIRHLMSNPIPCLVGSFINTLLEVSFPFKDSLDFYKKYMHSPPNQEVNLLNFMKKEHGLIRDVEVVAVYKRFLSSVVRQMSLYLSKGSSCDLRLRQKIGRFAQMKRHEDEDEKTIKSLRLTLRSFSWFAVIEILKAAEITIKPVRLGISKAQPKGIVSHIQRLGDRSSVGQSSHFAHSLLGANPRLSASNRRAAESRGSSVHIKKASRRPAESSSTLRPTKLIRSDSSEDESSASSHKDNSPGSFRDNTRSAVGTASNQGVLSTGAWTLDGHIRVSDIPRGRHSLQVPDFLDRRPDPDFVPSIHAGNCYLAQMFCRLVKEAVDLASDLLKQNEAKFCDIEENTPLLDVPSSCEMELAEYARGLLSKTWSWLAEVMNAVETQLRTGEHFDTQRFATRSLRTDTNISGGPFLGRAPSFSQSYVSRPEEYLIYLLKSGNEDENSHVFPILDLMSYSHVTFVLDAFFYMLKKWPLASSLDLAEGAQCKPHNGELQDNRIDVGLCQANRFFGFDANSFDSSKFQEHKNEILKKARSPYIWLAQCGGDGAVGNEREKPINRQKAQFKDRWKSTISAFAKLFLAEGPGMERECFLAEHAGTAGRVARFQRALSSLKDECLPKNMAEESQPFTVNIHRERFLADALKALIPLNNVDKHPYSSLNVRFDGEEGTGPGVSRGFFTGFAKALTGETIDRLSPVLLYQPGQLPEQAHVYCPKRIENYEKQLPYKFVYTGVGRFLGLSLWFNQTIPLIFTRPVLKFLLDKEDQITFDDLAFHNSTLYSSFSQMIIDAKSAEITEELFQEIYCCNFEFTIGGCVKELMPGGSNLKVTKENALELVRLTAWQIMVESLREDLESLRDGLQQIVPKELLGPLTAEDLQLLLSGGIDDIDLSRFKSIVRFNNSGSCGREIFERFKGWFWSIIREMTSSQRMKLLYFLTGSSVLPAFNNVVGNNEEISVTVDIGGHSISSLPVASTCGQRLTLPLYESRKELKKKLLIAIQCETYGLG